jgi:hypothetical protein
MISYLVATIRLMIDVAVMDHAFHFIPRLRTYAEIGGEGRYVGKTCVCVQISVFYT